MDVSAATIQKIGICNIFFIVASSGLLASDLTTHHDLLGTQTYLDFVLPPIVNPIVLIGVVFGLWKMCIHFNKHPCLDH